MLPRAVEFERIIGDEEDNRVKKLCTMESDRNADEVSR